MRGFRSQVSPLCFTGKRIILSELSEDDLPKLSWLIHGRICALKKKKKAANLTGIEFNAHYNIMFPR